MKLSKSKNRAFVGEINRIFWEEKIAEEHRSSSSRVRGSSHFVRPDFVDLAVMVAIDLPFLSSKIEGLPVRL